MTQSCSVDGSRVLLLPTRFFQVGSRPPHRFSVTGAESVELEECFFWRRLLRYQRLKEIIQKLPPQLGKKKKPPLV